MRTKNLLFLFILLPFTNITFSQSAELIKNGDFEAGNTGFKSLYNYCNQHNCLIPEGNYAVGTDAAYYHPVLYGKDHTTGNGKYMIINGGSNPRQIVWAERIAISPNTTYHFSCWISALNDAYNNEELLVGINGDTIAPAFIGVKHTGLWNQFTADWHSDTASFAVITIIDKAKVASGNDFGLDDISLQAVGTTKNAAANNMFSFFPNPVIDVLHVNYNSKTSTGISVKISNTMGTILQQKTMQATKGKNLFNINVAGYKNGLYYIELVSNEESKRSIFMIKK